MDLSTAEMTAKFGFANNYLNRLAPFFGHGGMGSGSRIKWTEDELLAVGLLAAIIPPDEFNSNVRVEKEWLIPQLLMAADIYLHRAPYEVLGIDLPAYLMWVGTLDGVAKWSHTVTTASHVVFVPELWEKISAD